MAKKKRLRDLFKEELDFPVGLGKNESTVEIMGRCRVMVHGCTGIIEYGERLMSLKTGEGRVDIKGVGLYCTAYMAGAVEISGKIESLTYGEGV